MSKFFLQTIKVGLSGSILTGVHNIFSTLALKLPSGQAFEGACDDKC